MTVLADVHISGKIRWKYPYKFIIWFSTE